VQSRLVFLKVVLILCLNSDTNIFHFSLESTKSPALRFSPTVQLIRRLLPKENKNIYYSFSDFYKQMTLGQKNERVIDVESIYNSSTCYFDVRHMITVQFATCQASRSPNSTPFYSRERRKTLFLSVFRRSDSLLPSFGIFFRGSGSSDPLADLADILFPCSTLFMSSCINSFACSSSISSLRSSGFFLSFKEGVGH